MSPFQGVMVEKPWHQDPEAASQRAATPRKPREMNASPQFGLLRYSLTDKPRGLSQVILDSVKLTIEINHHTREDFVTFSYFVEFSLIIFCIQSL